MIKLQKVFTIICVVLFIGACSDEPVINEGEYPGYTLKWQDEFDSRISSTNWTFETGNGTDFGLPPGWGNNELQIYTESQNNAIIKPDGEGNTVLAIVAQKNGNSYTSAKLTTNSLQSFRFGRIEARVKIPVGRGLWSAFWLLGDNRGEIDWPGCGEIDIVEVIGHEPNVVHSSAHYTNSENKYESNTDSLTYSENLSLDYHIYRLDWTPNSMQYFIDDLEVNQIAIEDDMKEFLRSFYIIFNIAVGGNWPGDPDESTVFPKEMLIDWVRYYAKDDLTAPQEPELNIPEETIGVLLDFLAKYAFNSTLNQFEGIGLKSFGDGGDPEITTSGIAIEGDSSLMFNYPGGGWGGGFFELETPIDASMYAGSDLVFSINAPAEMTDFELKLESVGTFISLYISDYTGVDVGNGFIEYRIPLSDFVGLELNDLRIPFALWNPVVASGDYLNGSVLIDNIYFD